MTFQELFDNFLEGMGLFVTDWDLLDDGLIEAGFLDGLETEVKGE
jgi:hypothetical protein